MENKLELLIYLAEKVGSTDTFIQIGDKKLNLGKSHLGREVKNFTEKYHLKLGEYIEKNKDKLSKEQLNRYNTQFATQDAFLSNVIELMHIQAYMLLSMSESLKMLNKTNCFPDGKISNSIVEVQQKVLNQLYKRVKVIGEFKKDNKEYEAVGI